MLGDVKLAEIDGRLLVWWMDQLGERRKTDGTAYARAAVHSSWAVLRAVLRDAMVLAGLDRDPTAGVRFSVKGASPRERGAVTIRHSQVKGVVGTTKTGRRREVPLHGRTAELLRELRRQQVEKQVRGLEKGLVFPSTQGGYRYNSMLTRPMKRCAVRAGIRKDVSTHTMRRSFNNVSRQVAGEIVTRAMMGHSTEAMTAHDEVISLDEKRAALDAALGKLGENSAAGGDRRWGSEKTGVVSTGG